MSEGIRLNKFLASCGVGSRRKCDELIGAGRVEINGQPCVALGTRVTEADAVRVDGKRVKRKSTVVLALHKPRGLVCSKMDELGRETIYSLLPGRFRNLHHVGRLDLDSEGLLILTNDGDLTQQLMHPSLAVEKEYFVTADQAFLAEHLDQFLEGVHTPEGKLKAKSIERISPRRIKVVLDHGAKRQIRVMFEALGYRVMKLLRVRIGSLWLGDLAVGSHAVLQPREIDLLMQRAEKADARVVRKIAKKKVVRARKSPPKKESLPADPKSVRGKKAEETKGLRKVRAARPATNRRPNSGK